MAVSGVWTYTESGGNATITDYDQITGASTPTIPDTLDGYPVIALGSNSMASKSLTAVTLGANLVTLGYNCLGSNSFTNIPTFPSSLTTIGERAFVSCTSMAGDLVIPESVTTLGNSAFYNTDAITSITMNYTVEIGQRCFSYCDGLTSVTIGGDVTTVAGITDSTSPFWNTPLGNMVTISSGVTTIRNSLFYSAGLTSITIPTTVTTIEDYAFYSNEITSLTLNHVVDLGDKCFADNTEMTSLTIGANVTTNAVSSQNTAPFMYNAIGAGLTISEGVTAIDDYMFSLLGLTSVTLPSTLLTIGNRAFSSNNIGSLTLPSTLLTIGDGAFTSNNIGSLTIPSSVTSIGDYTFAGCGITGALTIPTNITTIPFRAFYNNSISSLTISHAMDLEGQAFYINPNMTLTIDADITTSTITDEDDGPFVGCSLGSNVTINSGVTTIPKYLFSISGLTSITIPTTVTTIGDYAFYSNEITSLTLNHVVDLGDKCFADNTEMTSLTIGANVTTNTISSDSYAPFMYNAIGAGLTISEGVTAIDDYIFSRLGLTSLTLPSTLLTIGNRAFYSNSLAIDLTIPSSVTTIDDTAFAICTLTSVTMNSVVDLGNRVFYANGSMTVTIGANITTNGVTSPDTGPFDACTLGSGVTISAGVTTIDDYLFGDSALTEITFPSSVTTVNQYALYNNDNLTSITFEAEETVTFGSNVLNGTTPSPKGVIYGYDSSVGTWASGYSTYYDYSGLNAWSYTESGGELTITDYDTGIGGFTPTIPEALHGTPVVALGSNSMASKSLTSVTINHAINLSSNAVAFNSGLSVILNADVTTTGVSSPSVAPFEGCSIGSGLTIGAIPTTIPNYLFAFAGLTSLTIPVGLTSIGNGSFENNSLTSIDLVNVETVNQRAFYNNSLTSIDISNVLTINNNAFTNNSISSVTFDHAMTVYGEAFKNNTGISVTLDADITGVAYISYAYGIFRDCNIGSNITITSNVTTIPISIFANAGVTSVTLPSTITEIDRYAFYGNSGLTSITLPSNLTIINTNAFDSCGLTSLTLPSSLTTIDRNAFEDNSISSITFDHVLSVGEDAFRNNSGISVVLDANISLGDVLSYANGMFRDCDIGSNITITSNVTTIPKSIFANAGVTSVTLPNTVTKIDWYAFYGNSISSITFDRVVDLGSKCFAYNTGLAVTLDADVVTTSVINETYGPFEGSLSGDNLTITNNVTTIPAYLFCEAGFTTITFPSTVISIGNRCLVENDDLTSITFEAQETVTFGSDVLLNSEPSPKGTIYGYDESVETWASNWSTYYDFAYISNGRLKKYVGGEWVVYPLKINQASVWTEYPLKHWNGSEWVT